MSEIRTVAELLALPVESVVLTEVGPVEVAAWDQFLSTGDDHKYSAHHVMRWQPIRVIYRPDAGVTRAMVRCCGSDSCTATTPLPPGSSWLCSAHSNLLPGGGTR